jgi:hypothetical protein
MKYSQRPRYRVEFLSSNPRIKYTAQAWYVRDAGGVNRPLRKGYGAPNALNLAAFVAAFEISLQPGGSNAHLGPDTIKAAAIFDQEQDGLIVATYGDMTLATSSSIIRPGTRSKL